MPAPNATGRRVMPATNATVSARAISPGPSVSVLTLPRDGPSSTAVNAARVPASTHTVVETRRTEMPARRAASGLAATAWIRRPTAVERNSQVSASAASGTKIRIMNWRSADDLPPIVTDQSIGVGHPPAPVARDRGRQLLEERDGVEQLGHADGGHHEHEPGAVEEPAYHHQLDERRHRRGQKEGEQQRHPVVHVAVVDGLGHQQGRERSELAVGEVHGTGPTCR